MARLSDQILETTRYHPHNHYLPFSYFPFPGLGGISSLQQYPLWLLRVQF